MNDKTVAEYRDLLKRQNYSEEVINKYLGNMPEDSRNARNKVEQLLLDQTKDKNGNKIFTSSSGLASALKSGSTSFKHFKHLEANDRRLEQGKVSLLPGNRYGYGQGMKAAINADNSTHVANIFKHMPLSPSSFDAIANSVGILTPAQVRQGAAGGTLTKVMNASIPLGVAGFSTYQMLDGEDAGDILATNLSFGTGLIGWRMGKAIGGALTPKGATVSRLAGMGLAGTSGFLAGLVGFQAAYEGMKDMTSNQSSIAKKAKEIYTRSHTVNLPNTQEATTLRARSMNKLSSSALNDRGTMLGNEALIMKNLR